jgi:exopolysaccharide biosynthesis predicted pyruvyltransferase EpsI
MNPTIKKLLMPVYSRCPPRIQQQLYEFYHTALRKPPHRPAQDIILRLQNRIRTELAPYTAGLNDFALLDFPNYSNVGDSAIWLGEIAYFKDTLNVRPSYICTIESFSADALRQAVPNGPIFLSGGGNFGDMWPVCQAFREYVLAQFPDRLVVQLPQTIHFEDKAICARTAAAIKAHGKLILCVRDRPSLKIAKSSFDCPVHLVPDMAFCLGAQNKPVMPQNSILFLLRTDKESTRANPAIYDLGFPLPDSALVADWLDEEPGLYERLKAETGESISQEALFHKVATHRFWRGARLLSSASFVATDRLHSHIMCILLNIHHAVLDNSYGKVSAFVEAWTKDCDLVQMATSLDVFNLV